MLKDWLSLSEVASAAGVTARALQRCINRSVLGCRPLVWRGSEITFRSTSGRGGLSGLSYEIQLASLSDDLQARCRASQGEDAQQTPSLIAVVSAKGTAQLRKAIASYIVASGARGTPARAAAMRLVASALKETGRPTSERTLRDWVAGYEQRGLLAASRRGRADKGKARVIAWRAWDRAMSDAGVSEAAQRTIAARINADVRGLWANGEVSGANIQMSMTVRCRAYAEEAGVKLPDPEMAALSRMPLHYAGEKTRRRARMAYVKGNDAARWASHHVPRVRRHRDNLRPMDLVAVDVRHSDIVYRRSDGSLATPKIVAFLDLATNRLFARAFLLPKGEMIRREHVLMTMRDLAADPCWGLWRGLYLDNGGEFELGAAPEDLTHLVDLVRRVYGDDAVGAYGNITSRPYNPQSKVIESIFSAFTRSIEPIYQGFVGGNRMAKKTQNQGREPVPMPGDETAIIAQFANMLAFYNAKQQQNGHIKGRSPNEAFAAFVRNEERPWSAILLDPREFALAFGPDEWRTVQPGGELHVRNRILVHPELATMVGEKVRVRLPVLDPTRAVLLSDKGEPVLVANELAAVGIRDLAGVRKHDLARRAAAKAAVNAAAGATKINPATARAAVVASLPLSSVSVPIATASVHPVLRQATDEDAGDLVPARSKRDAARHAQRAALKELADLSRAS